jgi:DNA-binding transcriptional LysR family regulator
LDQLTAQFILLHPDVQVTLDVITTPQVLENITDGRSDIGLAELREIELPTNVRKISYRRSQYVCALREDHPLASKDVIVPADLHERPFIALVKRNSARAMIDRLLAKTGSSPNIVVETSNAVSAINYVAAGSGIAVVNSFPLMQMKREEVMFKPFEPTLFGELDIYLASGSRARALPTLFAEFLADNQVPEDLFSQAM